MAHSLKSEVQRTQGRSLDGLVDRMQHQEDHYTAIGTAPSCSYVTDGNGTATIDSTSTDVAGRVTFANTWANGDMLTIHWNENFNTAPVVLYSSWAANASGESLNEIDAYHSSTSGSSLEASGTCTKSLEYVVVESI
tara:strand:- start:338 stop:748 length:411 start_codon:yes stop_codon:yes gene_type:complete